MKGNGPPDDAGEKGPLDHSCEVRNEGNFPSCDIPGGFGDDDPCEACCKCECDGSGTNFIGKDGKCVPKTDNGDCSPVTLAAGQTCDDVCCPYKVVLPAGPIPAPDATCDPFDAAYDPQQCPVYFEPFFLADASSSSSQYEQVDGKDGICTVDPLTSTAGDKFIMTYVGRLASDPTDTCKSVLCRNNIVFSLFSTTTNIFYSYTKSISTL